MHCFWAPASLRKQTSVPRPAITASKEAQNSEQPPSGFGISSKVSSLEPACRPRHDLLRRVKVHDQAEVERFRQQLEKQRYEPEAAPLHRMQIQREQDRQVYTGGLSSSAAAAAHRRRRHRHLQPTPPPPPLVLIKTLRRVVAIIIIMLLITVFFPQVC